ncbi:MAG: PKD repeat protein [Rhodothermales bacterium]|jgi:PKD repeat protein
MRLLFSLLVALCTLSVAAQTRPQTRGEVLPDESVLSRIEGGARVNVATGIPLALYHSDYRATPGDPLEMAWSYLRARGAKLGLSNPETELVHYATRKTRSGYRVRFEQRVNGVPVYKSGIAVSLGEDGQIHFVVNDFKPGVHVAVIASKVGPESAKDKARGHIASEGLPSAEQVDLVVYANAGQSRLAHRVQAVTKVGAWDILVDAATGEVFRAEPTAHVGPRTQAMNAPSAGPFLDARAAPFRAPQRSAGAGLRGSRVDGSAFVFDPDPMSVLSATYGDDAQHRDNDDADNPALTAARTQVTLRDIGSLGGIFDLDGPMAVITDFDPPFLGTFGQASPDWDNTRSQPAFEATNVYYHIDQSMRYLNETLGFSVTPLQYTGGVQADPHGLEGAVNAQYLFTGQLRFGEGGADLAEDSDVVLHELGHAIHDWITDNGLSQQNGLSEGVGDYWAASYTRSKNLWPVGTSQRDQMGRWGGRPFFAGRRTDYPGRFPADLTGQVHADGRIWASAMMSVWDEVGGTDTDVLFWEGMSMTGSGSNTEDAARAVLKADSLLFGAAHADVMLEAFTERGFLFRAAAAGVGRSGPGPRPVTFFDLSVFGEGSANSWAWDFESDGQVDAGGGIANHTFPDPGLYSVTLTASDGNRTQTTTLTDYVSVNSGVYVWEGFGIPEGRSGRYIYDALQEAGVESYYSRTAAIHPSLEGFGAVFLSFGPSDPLSAPTPLGEVLAGVIRTYIEGGGNVYIEGGDVLGFHQVANTRLLEKFGIGQARDGLSGTQPVTDLRGQAGSLAQGEVFISSKQTATRSVDLFAPSGSGRALFEEVGYGVVAIQNQDAGGGRTVAMSYTLADLEPNGTSTRDQLLVKVMDFFGMPIVLAGEDSPELPASLWLDAVYPNPLSGQGAVRFALPNTGRVDVEVYDMLGRRVAVLLDGEMRQAGAHEVILNASNLPSGSYIVSLGLEGRFQRRSVVVVR